MLPGTTFKSFYRYPVTACVAGVSIIVTAWWWLGQEIEGLCMNSRVWERWELWRAVTSTFPHVNFLHLAFNLYWFWTFGTLVEKVYGHLKFAGIFLLLALSSSLVEFTFLFGGVGLSGVGYGLWAMLWVLQRRDARFANAVDDKTNQMFVGWFFLCIVLTITEIMPVGNVAHATGVLVGAILGVAASSHGAVKRKSLIGLTTILLFGLVGATIFWPWTTFSTYAQAELEYDGSEALQQNDDARAIKLLKVSAQMKGALARTWFNLGIAYHRLKRYEDALAAYEHAAKMPDATSEMSEAAGAIRDYLIRLDEWQHSFDSSHHPHFSATKVD